MSYGTPGAKQLLTVAVFLGTGFLLGLLFELLRFLRRLFAGEGTAAIRVQDLLFCAASFFVLFVALLAYSDGELRLHLLLAAAGGFFSFRCSAGRFLRKTLDRFSRTAQMWGAVLLRPFQSAAVFVRGAFGSFFASAAQKRRELKKLRKNRKKGLKKEEKSV